MEIFAQLFEIIINWIHGLTGDFGIAIVIITVAIRSCLVPLNIRQRKQMKKQQETSREIEAIKTKYGKNDEKFNLELQKAPLPTILILLLSNSLFVFSIPSGLGLYYFVSGLFVALEQFVTNLIDVHKAKKVSLA